MKTLFSTIELPASFSFLHAFTVSPLTSDRRVIPLKISIGTVSTEYHNTKNRNAYPFRLCCAASGHNLSKAVLTSNSYLIAKNLFLLNHVQITDDNVRKKLCMWKS